MGLDDELEGKVNVVPIYIELKNYPEEKLEGTLLKGTTFTFPSSSSSRCEQNQELSKL